MIVIEQLSIPDVLLMHSPVFPDPRGALEETWNAEDFAMHDLGVTFVQDLLTTNDKRGTLRGLHFQMPPHAQAKVIRVVTGSIFDVAVDLRESSPTFGHHVSIELSAGTGRALFIPKGFAHGFCTLEDATRVQYKVAGRYAPDCAGGIIWNDPDLNIAWPVKPSKMVLSDADRALPLLSELPILFD